jgi:hypothetical protein
MAAIGGRCLAAIAGLAAVAGLATAWPLRGTCFSAGRCVVPASVPAAAWYPLQCRGTARGRAAEPGLTGAASTLALQALPRTLWWRKC